MQQLLDDMAAASRWGVLSNKLGFVVISSVREVVHVPKRATRVQAGWGQKHAEAPESDTTVDEDVLSPRYAKAFVTIRRSALRYGDPAVDAIVTRDLGEALDDTIDTG
jgi:HK97 family phage major capsid protein